jgi:hypothetical protein
MKYRILRVVSAEDSAYCFKVGALCDANVFYDQMTLEGSTMANFGKTFFAKHTFATPERTFTAKYEVEWV